MTGPQGLIAAPKASSLAPRPHRWHSVGAMFKLDDVLFGGGLASTPTEA